jgi:exosortase/archaeosortase family protein
VTIARSAGAIPARPFHIHLSAGRTSLLACAGVLAALNAEAGQIFSEAAQPLSGWFANLAGISAIIWFAMYIAVRIGLEPSARPPSRRDTLVLCVVVALSFLPVTFAAKAALLLSALYLLATSAPQEPARRVGLVLVALTGPLIWGRILLDAFGSPILNLDAHLVAAAIGTSAQGNIVHFVESGKQFHIAPACSSVHNISLALVLWTTAAAAFRLRFDRRFIACGLAMIAFMFVLNIARLAAIGLYPAQILFLHDGAGAALFGWAGLIGAGCIAFAGVNDAVGRQQ